MIVRDLEHGIELDLALPILGKLMSIPTGSKNHQNILVALEFITAVAKNHVDEILEIPSSLDDNPPLTILRIHGETKKRMAFIMHIDAVSNNTNFKIEDDFYIGQGSADNKASIALILTLIQTTRFKELSKFYTLDFIISPNEELGSLGHHDSFKYLSSDLDYVFGLEPSPCEGHLISSRNGNRWYNITFQGIASHTGRFDDPSLNSCHEASVFISELMASFSYSHEYRINVGHLATNTSGFNTVPEQTTLKLDTRFKKIEHAHRIDLKINELLLKNSFRCHKTERMAFKAISIADDCPPMEEKKMQKLDFGIIENLIQKYEYTPLQLIHSGGAADINYFDARFAKLDGLGPIGGKMHTKDEFMKISSLKTRIFLLNDLIEQLGNVRRDYYVFKRNST